MTRRAVRGLADLSDLEDDQEEESVTTKSIFDTKVYNDKVLEKIRVGEDEIVAAPKEKKDLTTLLSSDSESTRDSDCQIIPEASDPPARVPRRSARLRSAENSPLPTTKRRRIGATERKSKRQSRDASARSGDLQNDSFSFLNDSVNVSSEDESHAVEYRILVRHYNHEKGIWARVPKDATMRVVFDEVEKVLECSRVTLMMDVGAERREVFPEQTAKDLNLDPNLCCVMHAYLSTSDRSDATTVGQNQMRLKFITTHRRKMRELICGREESFESILKRYCQAEGVPTGTSVLRFDGDRLDESDTPADLDMDPDDQIEVHSLSGE